MGNSRIDEHRKTYGFVLGLLKVVGGLSVAIGLLVMMLIARH
ncbi:hypothetical protein [Sphingomonas sp.]|nr:hypothetical protein [Sphingomonas sp.]